MPNEFYSLVWDGLPNVMAVDRAGRHLVLQSPRENGLIVLDLISEKVVHRAGSINGSRVSYGYGPDGSPLIVSTDDAYAIWSESLPGKSADRRTFVRRISLSSGETEVLADFSLHTGVLMQADTPEGLYLAAAGGLFLIDGGRAVRITIDGVEDLRSAQVVTNGHATWLLGYVISVGAIAVKLAGATAGPIQRLDIAGAPLDSVVSPAGIWIKSSGTPGVEGRTYLLDPETLALRASYSVTTNGGGAPSALAAGPHGAFLSTLGDTLFRLISDGPPLRLASPNGTTRIVDTDSGLYGMTPYGVWRREMSDFSSA